MNRMPCSITDNPYSDASYYYEGEGVYKSKPEPNPDDAYDEWRLTQTRCPRTGNLEPLITPFQGDVNE